MIATLTKGMILDGVSVLVEKKSEGTTKTGKAFLNLTARDKTGSIAAKLWEYSAEAHGFIREGEVVAIWGSVDEYNGSLQLVVRGIEPSLETADKYLKSSKFNVDEMWTDLVNIVGTFQEPLTKFVTEEILLRHEAFAEAFKKAPAAKTVHNAWYGGLLEHVHALCLLAEPMIRHYQSRYCEKISRDKVLFGLMMHDAGKIIEYDTKSPSFLPTPVGVFTNHLVIGPAWVFEKANIYHAKTPGIDTEKFRMERAHLMHILAAHHGRLDWGSPVKPASLEALLVHHLDNLDAKMMHAMELVQGKRGPIQGFSERSYFEGTQFYQYQ